MMVDEYLSAVKSGAVNVIDHVQKIVDECEKLQPTHHLLNATDFDSARNVAKSVDTNLPLAGLCVSVKDCICVKDMESTAGSKALKGYTPVFDATVIQRLRDAGAIIIGKTAQDEFGFGGFSVNVGVGFEIPKNPLDSERSCGGSSGGSAALTQALSKIGGHVSIAESTGGSIAAPAAFCGVVGFTPTYGRVSRYGLIDYGNSLDKIGPMGMKVSDCAQVMNVIAGYDEKDSTSSQEKVPDYVAACSLNIKGMKIGVIKNRLATDEIQAMIGEAAEWFKSQGAEICEVYTNLACNHGVNAYYLLAMSEASTNLAKYCGMRYGHHEKLSGGFNEYFTHARTEAFGKEAKRRLLVGTYARMAGYRDAFYIKALKVRTKIISEYKKVFSNCDVILSPTMPMVAPRFDEIEKLTPMQHYLADRCTAPVNLAGLPHMSIPCGTIDNMPVGMMLISDHFNEEPLFALSSAFEKRGAQ